MILVKQTNGILPRGSAVNFLCLQQCVFTHKLKQGNETAPPLFRQNSESHSAFSTFSGSDCCHFFEQQLF
jgi:hypothetical protein